MKTVSPKTIITNIQLYNLIIKELADRRIYAYIRHAKTGNMHIVVQMPGINYSVIRFAHTNKFRVFYPFPSFNKTQEKIDCSEWTDVVKFITEV
jgi:hypothetical protein